ncbi:unnamed protein product, partial [Hapterophycus canaliculatus]
MVVGDGNKLRVECFGDLDLVLHCEGHGARWRDVPVMLKGAAVVPGLCFDIISFNQI